MNKQKKADVKSKEDTEEKDDGVEDMFRTFSVKIADIVGRAWTFIAMLIVTIVWLLSGPIFHFSDTWQLIINTGTTIITFLIVFIIQNTQNRDTKAIQLKLDELLRCHKLAHNSIINLNKLSDKQIKSLESHYEKISKESDDESEKK
jgi:low affinity Fe/Cu permease